MCVHSSTNIEEKVEDIIFKYLSTPLACNKTPAELHYNRHIRTKLHLLKPPMMGKISSPELKQRSFKVGQRVLS